MDDQNMKTTDVTPTHDDDADNNNNNTTTNNKKSSTLARFRQHPRVVQNFVLVWLDPNVGDPPDDEYRELISQIRQVINGIYIFNEVHKCIKFLHEVRQEKAFLIVSGAIGRQVLPYVHDIVKLDSIYIFCGAPQLHEPWAKKWLKIRGVFTQMPPICELLKQATQKCKTNFLSLSFVKPTDIADQNFDQLDQSFMYTQILKEILLEIEYDEQAFKDLVNYCRDLYSNNSYELDFIKEFEKKYHEHSPIYWYTHPGFIYSMLNRALRTLEVDTIIKMGFFIQDLYKEINKLHLQQTHEQEKQSFIVYRGQGLAKDDFEKLLKAKGGLMSFNNFLSTSKKRDVALEFTKDAFNNNTELIGVVFKMVIDPSELATPYAFIDKQSYFKSDEEEILFSMHTVFRIGEIKQIQKNDQLYQVILTLTNSKNKQLSSLTELLRDEIQGSTGWHRLGMLLIKLGKYNKAEQVYKTLTDLNTDDNDKALVYHQLGLIKRNQGNYTDALAFYKQALDMYEKTRTADDLDLATTYNNIGQVYNSMGEYAEALSYYEKALEIYERNLPKEHVSLAISYNNIGLIYRNLGDYNRALISHEKALEIEQKTLPANHPSLATSYKNIGLVYKNKGEYSKALTSHEKALEIEQKTLPSNHPALAISYNNIGLLYNSMGEYSKALSYDEKTLEIYQEILPPNHPDFAMSFNNIGTVYKNLGQYPKALSFYKRTLEIEEKALPENHPSLAISYNNIGLVYDNMGDYSKAISSYEKALEICQKTLSLEHPTFAVLYNNMGSVHDNMGDYNAALTWYKKALEIEQKILPSDHPDLATSYNNIGLIYDKLEESTEAFSYHEKALAIYQKSLPPNHPDLATSYNNIGLACQKIQEYSKALSYYQKAFEIRQQILPVNHPDLIICYANLSQVYAMMSEYPKALSFYEQLVQARKKPTANSQSNSSRITSNDIIDQIYENNKHSSKISLISDLNVEFNQQPTCNKLCRITSFRKRLEKIRQKCQKQ